jgi:hypothetical protein
MAFLDEWLLGDAVRDYLYKQHGTEAGLDYGRLNNREVQYERNSDAEEAYKEWANNNTSCADNVLDDDRGPPLEEIFMLLNLEGTLTGSVKALYETGDLLDAVMALEFEACFLRHMKIYDRLEKITGEGSEPPSKDDMDFAEKCMEGWDVAYKYTKGRALVRSVLEAGQQLIVQLSCTLESDGMIPPATRTELTAELTAKLTAKLTALPSQLDSEEINARRDCNSGKVSGLCAGMKKVVEQVGALSEAFENDCPEVIEKAAAVRRVTEKAKEYLGSAERTFRDEFMMQFTEAPLPPPSPAVQEQPTSAPAAVPAEAKADTAPPLPPAPAPAPASAGVKQQQPASDYDFLPECYMS